MNEYPLNYNGFKQGLESGRLLGLSCQDCGATTAPPNGVCTTCGSRSLRVQELSARGRITTFTVVRVSPQGFRPPYVVALVQLQEGPCVMGNLIEVDVEKLDMNLIGREVSVSHRTVEGLGEDDQDGVALTFTLLE